VKADCDGSDVRDRAAFVTGQSCRKPPDRPTQQSPRGKPLTDEQRDAIEASSRTLTQVAEELVAEELSPLEEDADEEDEDEAA